MRILRRLTKMLPLLGGLWLANAHAVSGNLDPDFGTGGIVVTDFGSSVDEKILAMRLDEQERMVVAGSVPTGLVLVRYLTGGTLDTSFGTGGKVALSGTIAGGRVRFLSDGRLVQLTTVSKPGAKTDMKITRFNTDGSLDAGFGTNGVVVTDFGPDSTSSPTDAFLLGDGRMVVVGSMWDGVYRVIGSSFYTDYDVCLASYEGNGNLDGSFGSGGKVTTDVAGFNDSGLGISSGEGGTLLAGSTNGLLRYLPGGGLDPTFGSGGKVLNPHCRFLLKQLPGGKILAGATAHNGNNADFALARHLTGGAFDPAFGTGGKVMTDFLGYPSGTSDDTGVAMIVQADGMIYIGGTANFGATSLDFALARYHPGGVLDAGFGTAGKVSTAFSTTPNTDQATCMVQQADGKIILGGFTYKNFNADFALVRYLTPASSANADLASVTSATATITPVTASVYACTVPTATSSITVTATAADPLASISINGGTVSVSTRTATLNGLAFGVNTFSIGVTAEDGVTTHAYTLQITRPMSSNANLSNLTFTPGSFSPSFAPATTSYAITVGNPVNAVTVRPTKADAAASITVNGTSVVSGQSSPAINLGVGDNVISVVVTAQDGMTKTYTIQVMRAGAGPGDVESGFSVTMTGTAPSVYATGLQPDGRIVIGGLFGTVGGSTRNNVARVQSQGQVDTGFNPDANAMVRCLAVQADGRVILGGDFTQVGGVNRDRLARVNPDGTLDTSFNPAPDYPVSSVVVQPDGKILIAGGFTSLGATPRKSVARLLESGAVDPSFDPGVGTNAAILHLALQEDGKVLISGAFTTVSDVPHTGVARLTSTGAVDAGFANPAVAGTNAAVTCTSLQADGKVVIGGNFTTVGGVAHVGLARLNANGTVDGSFTTGVGNSVAMANVWSLARQADGRLLVAGTYDSIGGVTREGLARLTPTGSVDTAFMLRGATSMGASVGFLGVQLLTDGKVLVAGPHLAGATPAYFSRLINDVATQSLSAPTASSLLWQRAGSVPEAQQAAFDVSTNGGSTWTALGNATRVTGGWQLTGVSPPAGGIIRGRARVAGGQYNGSSGFVAYQSAPGAAAPTVVTGVVAEYSSTSVLLEGMVNPNGAATTAVLEYGPTTGYGSSLPVTPSPNNGSLNQTLSVLVGGLSPGSVYHFRLSATNAQGTTNGLDVSFATPGSVPVVATGPASQITTRTATVAGAVTVGASLQTGVVFEYGTTTAYGSFAAVPAIIGSATNAPVTASLKGLQPGTLYHYRLVASNLNGAGVGADMTFTTLAAGVPVMDVQQPAGVSLADGVGSVDFGSRYTTRGFTITFTIQNDGTGDLTLGTPVIDGPHGADFTLTGSPAATLPPGGSTTLALRFDPAGSGSRTAALHLPNNDSAHHPFDLALTGAGLGTGGSIITTLSPAEVVTAGATWCIDSGINRASGTTATGQAPGSHVMAFNPIPGYTTPPHQTVDVTAGGTVNINAAYVPVSSQYQWTNFAGQPGGPGGVNGSLTAARFDGPADVALDGVGNLLVTESGNFLIRKITPAGVVSTVLSTSVQFQPQQIVVDGAGNLFVSGTDYTIRKITPEGVITTLAGAATQSGWADGQGGEARFSWMGGMAVDGAGNLYLADTGNHVIRKITPAGMVTTLAGMPGVPGYANSAGGVAAHGAALFNGPRDVVVDGPGNVYVADSENNCIRKITPAGQVSTLAGHPSFNGSKDGAGMDAQFGSPTALCLAPNGGLMVLDFDQWRSVTGNGIVTTLAEGGGQMVYVTGVCADASGNFYGADVLGHAIYKFSLAEGLTLYAGAAPSEGLVNGTGTAAKFNAPKGMACDASGNLYLADEGNGVLRKITPAGEVSTLAAGFSSFSSVCMGSDGHLYLADTQSHTIRKVTLAGLVSTFAGALGQSGSTNEQGVSARFNRPAGIAADAVGNLYVADTSNHLVRKITSAGLVSTLAGSAGLQGSTDGTGSAARFNYPAAICADGSGGAYVADFAGIRRVTSAGVVTTILYDNQVSAFVSTLVAGPGGSLLLTDYYNHLVLQATVNGEVTILGGTSRTGGMRGLGGDQDGLGSGALFSGPEGVLMLPNGTVYVADTGNNRLSKGVLMNVTPVKLAVEQPVGTRLTNGASTIDFGPLAVGNGVAKVFTIKNTGTSSLSGVAIGVDGPASGDFSYNLTGMKTTLAAGASTVFTVTFRTASLGARDAVLHVSATGSGAFNVGLTGMGSPGIVFEKPLNWVEEEVSPALITLIRTGSTAGAASVQVSSKPGAATAADFDAVQNVLVSFADGQATQTVAVVIKPDTLTEVNEDFTLTLGSPLGAAIGSGSSTTVRIIDLTDTSKPTVTLITPAANAHVQEGGSVTLTGTAGDNKGLNKVQYSHNGSPMADAMTTVPTSGVTASFTAAISPQPGLNTVTVQSWDTRENNSSPLTRSFTYHVPRTLTVAVDGPAGSGSVSTGFAPNSMRDVGMQLTITATPKTGFVFDGWTVNDATGTQITPDSMELPALTFVMQENLALTAHFIANPFAVSAGLIGAFNGPVTPSETEPAGGTETDVSTVGHFTATVTSTGSFSGTLKLDGASIPVTTGVFDNDGQARFGKTRDHTLTLKRKNKPDLVLELELDMEGVTDDIKGTVTQKAGNDVEAVSDVVAERSAFSSKSPVPSGYASAAGQRYSLILPARLSQPGLTAEQYPPGTGIGFMTVKADGGVSFSGTLADSTTFTAATSLSEDRQCPLFVQLYTMGGSLAGLVTLDTTQPDSDALAQNCLWIRPAQPKVQWYPLGWPDSIELDLVAAKFIVPPASPAISVIPGLPTVGSGSSNATLAFTGGLLSAPVVRDIHISPANVLTQVPKDSTYTAALTKATGEVAGTFTQPGDGKKPMYKTTTIQKPGMHRGTWGWFLSAPATPVNGQGKGGAVSLLPKSF